MATKASHQQKPTSTLSRCSNQAEGNDQFKFKVADTLEDAIKLMEVGFEFHAEMKAINCSGKESKMTPNTTDYK